MVRVLLLVILFTAVGVSVLFADDLASLGTGTYAYLQGRYAYTQGDYDTAVRHYRQALNNGYPNIVQAYIRLGDAQGKIHDNAGAIRSYQQALKLNPTEKTALDKLAAMQRAAGHPRMALALYQNALQSNPDDLALNKSAGELYLALAKETNNPLDYRRATEMLQKLTFQKKDDRTQYRLAESLYAQGRYDEALEIYCALTEKHPKNPETLYSLAVALAKNNAPTQAVAYMIQAAELVDNQRPDLSQQWIQQAFRLKQNQPVVPLKPSEAATLCISKLQAVEEKSSSQPESTPSLN